MCRMMCDQRTNLEVQAVRFLEDAKEKRFSFSHWAATSQGHPGDLAETTDHGREMEERNLERRAERAGVGTLRHLHEWHINTRNTEKVGSPREKKALQGRKGGVFGVWVANENSQKGPSADVGEKGRQLKPQPISARGLCVSRSRFQRSFFV